MADSCGLNMLVYGGVYGWSRAESAFWAAVPSHNVFWVSKIVPSLRQKRACTCQGMWLRGQRRLSRFPRKARKHEPGPT
eukprot:scaffold65763_cov21-Tisochrysis_lutea.AAC.1